PSLFAELATFSGSSFFALDELHLIARGIGKHLFELISVAHSKDTKFYYTQDNTQSADNYPFYIPRSDLETIGNCISNSRQFIPISFQGSFDNIFQKIDGTRAVDWLDFLLYIIPTVVVPYLPSRAAKNAVLSLVKGCALALQWSLTYTLIDEMERHFKDWHAFLLYQVHQKTLSRSVFRPVQHYLIHIPHIIRRQGPLRSYSTRSMERVIGVYSKLIRSKSKGGRNASLLVERFAIHRYIHTAIDLHNHTSIIHPHTYNESSFINIPNDESGAQLWEPFHRNTQLLDDTIEGISSNIVRNALLRYYTRNTTTYTTEIADSSIVVASCLWKDSTVYSSSIYRKMKNETSRGNHHIMFTCTYKNWLVGTVEFYFQHKDTHGITHFLAFVDVMKEHTTATHDFSIPIVKKRPTDTLNGHIPPPTFAVINVNDIIHQVGLIQYPPNSNQFFMIAPYFIFNTNLRITNGNLYRFYNSLHWTTRTKLYKGLQ
ncbi:hypothetical protein CLU79DRAFT_710433, partial [Phycomyces nitens]